MTEEAGQCRRSTIKRQILYLFLSNRLPTAAFSELMMDVSAVTDTVSNAFPLRAAHRLRHDLPPPRAPLPNEVLEPWCININVVFAGFQKRNCILAAPIRDRLVFDTGSRARDGHLGIGHRRIRWIRDEARDGPTIFLCHTTWHHEKYEDTDTAYKAKKEDFIVN
jgi:hypothetical protein